jgi:hypothetical protein
MAFCFSQREPRFHSFSNHTRLGRRFVVLYLHPHQELPAAGRNHNDLVSRLHMPQSGRIVVHLRKR